MNIGVVFDGELQSGGCYQTQLSTILELKKLNQYLIIAIVFSIENKTILENFGIETIVIKKTFFNQLFRFINRQECFCLFSSRLKLKTSFEKKLEQKKIDLVYFLSPSTFSLDLVAMNYVITVWDLCHRDTPEFPEVNNYREFEKRELLYTKSLKKSVAILVDSQLGKDSVVKRYGIDEYRVYVVPFSPSINIKETIKIDIKQKYNIESEYIYYPAQFWSHKNHVYIIDALVILKAKGISLSAVFSGSDKGNLEYVLSYAKSKGVEKLVKYIGFAPSEEIYHLYKQSLALVMPSYFGPTNIPPLEAFAIGVPVIYSDLKGLREQVGDGALLCNLKSPENLAQHLMLLQNSQETQNAMIFKGQQRFYELQKVNVVNILTEIFDNFETKLKCWKC